MGELAAALQTLSSLLPRIAANWSGSKWEWDGRLDCGLSVIPSVDEARARTILTDALPAIWTADTLPGAPPLIQQICARTGALLAGQMVFSAALPDGVFAYALWWPWGNATRVSVRVGVSHQSALPGLRAALGL